MKVIVSKEIIRDDFNARSKIDEFFKNGKIPVDWAVNIIEDRYIFEYIESESDNIYGQVNIFGEINDDYQEIVL